MSNSKTQSSGDDSTNIQGESVSITNITINSVEGVAKELLESTFGELPEDTIDKIEQNQASYLDTLKEVLKKHISEVEDIREVISSPDFQYVNKQAAISASRSDSKELHQNLALLLSKRIESDDDDIKRIVYNESIEVTNKLTRAQLNILSLTFIGFYTMHRGIFTINDFISYVSKSVSPFLGTSFSDSQFQYLQYTGCATISVMHRDILDLIKKNYTLAFANDLSDEDIRKADLSDSGKRFIHAQDKESFIIKVPNKKILEESIDGSGLDEHDANALRSLYEKMTPNKSQVEEVIKRRMRQADDFLDLFKDSSIKNLQLSAVGIAIGATHYEKSTGEKLQIDKWIN